MSDFVPVTVVCERLNISPDTFDRNYRYEPGFPPELHGKRWRWEDVDKWMRANPIKTRARRARSTELGRKLSRASVVIK